MAIDLGMGGESRVQPTRTTTTADTRSAYQKALDEAEAAAGGGGATGSSKDPSKDLVAPVGGFVFPIANYTGQVGDSFGAPRSDPRGHQGADLFAPRGTPVVATVAGVIELLGSAGIGGNRIRLRASDGTFFYYAHLDSFTVTKGQRVEAGQQIGTVGDTGNAKGTGTHLHFEYHPGGGDAVNPTAYLTGSAQTVLNAPYVGGTADSAAGRDYRSFNEGVNDIFIYNLGRPASSSELSMVQNGMWSDDHIMRYMQGLSEFNRSPGYNRAAAGGQDLWDSMVGNTPVPEAELRNWVLNDYTQEQVKARIKSLPEYRYGNQWKTDALAFTDTWEQKTGIPLTYTARLKRDEAVQLGWSDYQWADWVESTDSYNNGTEMAGMKMNTIKSLQNLWGIGAVDEKLLADPNYIGNTVWAALGKNPSLNVVDDWARKQPEYLTGPKASTDRVNLRGFIGGLMRVPVGEELLTMFIKQGYNEAQVYEILRGTTTYKERYGYMPAWMDEGTFNSYADAYAEEGRRYFGNDFKYSMQQIGYFLEEGIYPTELRNRNIWTEDAWADLPGMNDLGKALGKSYSFNDAYLVASGGQGSGKIRAELIEAQNLRAFDTVFQLYNNRMPSPSDYAYLRANFLSPAVYAGMMKAKEDADAMFPEVDALFRRVYGYGADLSRLQAVAQGAQGSGAYSALIQAAEELDRYRLVWKNYTEEEPTPQQYAEWAGFAGPEELAKQIQVKELVDAEGPALMRKYNDYWVQQGVQPLSDDDIHTLVGKYEGWGAIDAKMQTALEHRQEVEQAQQQALSSGKAIGWVTSTPFGGSKVVSMARVRG